MRIVFLAPPGAGKGTQGALIKQQYKINQLSTGDILREHKEKKTDLGKEARIYMDAGELVPDDIIISMLKEEIQKDSYSNGFLLDGFPRTIPQAEALDRIFNEFNLKIDAAILIEVPKHELISRLSARRTCRQCGASFHLIFNPPILPNICDLCGEALFQRPDDQKETILNRLKIYESTTRSLVDYYSQKGIVNRIDGIGEVADVFKRIKTVLESVKQN